MSNVVRGWAIAVALVAVWFLATLLLRGTTGLVRTVVVNADQTLLDNRTVQSIGVSDVDGAAGGPAGLNVAWRGAWDVPETAFYTLALESHGLATWVIDGQVAVENAGERASRTLWLASGFRPIEIRYAADRDAPRLAAHVKRAGGTAEPLDAFTLKPRPPKNPFLRSLAGGLTWLLGAVAVLSIISAIRRTPLPQPVFSKRAATSLAWTLLAAILIHGALLRVDAITVRYGPVASPGWIAALQTRTFLSPDAIRSDWMVWTPEPLYPHADGVSTRYRSDPYIYLDIARNMTSFYEPQFREPVFPFATRMFLRAFDNQDVAVSFASTFFSLLAVWLTYLLGAALWSRAAGLIAALGLSINYDVVSLASLGWRDDAYVAMVVLCGYLMLRVWRAGKSSDRFYSVGRFRIDAAHVEAAALGLAGGVAILTRIMAVPLLVAGGFVVIVALGAPWRRRLAIVGIALAMSTLVAGPYFVNCWRVHGDPLYTFNVHGGIYSISEGKDEWKGTTASYVWQKIRTRPFEMFDTVAQGLTTYPFGNKWAGLDRWASQFGTWAAVAALAGLVLLAAFAEGRLLLVATLGSLLPFAFTWKVDPHFRFTEHAYPTFLIAAGIAVVFTVRLVVRMLAPYWPNAEWSPRFSSWRAWTSMVGGTLAVLWCVSSWSPAWVFSETLAAGEGATATAGVRDAPFFGSGWTPVLYGGNVNLRVTHREGSVNVHLPAPGDYPATLRLDPFPEPLSDTAPLPDVQIVLNGTAILSTRLHYTPGRVGAYDVVLPRAAVRSGSNRIDVRVAGPTAVGLWYVRVHPAVGNGGR